MGSCGNLEMWSPDSVKGKYQIFKSAIENSSDSFMKYFGSLILFSGKVKAKNSGTLANQQGCLINFPFSNV